MAELEPFNITPGAKLKPFEYAGKLAFPSHINEDGYFEDNIVALRPLRFGSIEGRLYTHAVKPEGDEYTPMDKVRLVEEFNKGSRTIREAPLSLALEFSISYTEEFLRDYAQLDTLLAKIVLGRRTYYLRCGDPDMDLEEVQEVWNQHKLGETYTGYELLTLTQEGFHLTGMNKVLIPGRPNPLAKVEVQFVSEELETQIAKGQRLFPQLQNLS